MKKILLILIFSLLLMPPSVFAAKFVQQPLFLSKSPVTEGQKVRLYAIVSNDATTTFSGTVIINADGTRLGSPAASLAVGATQTVSVFWTPTAGIHVITAQLTADDGTVVQQVSQSFPILAIPVPPAPVVAPVMPAGTANQNAAQDNPDYQPSTQIQQGVGAISPAIATDTKPLFNAIDTVRSSASNIINMQIGQINQTIVHNKNLKAASATEPQGASALMSISNPESTFVSFLWTSCLYVLILLRFIIGDAVVFYSLLVILLLYILWRIYKRYRRPSYGDY